MGDGPTGDGDGIPRPLDKRDHGDGDRLWNVRVHDGDLDRSDGVTDVGADESVLRDGGPRETDASRNISLTGVGSEAFLVILSSGCICDRSRRFLERPRATSVGCASDEPKDCRRTSS